MNKHVMYLGFMQFLDLRQVFLMSSWLKVRRTYLKCWLIKKHSVQALTLEDFGSRLRSDWEIWNLTLKYQGFSSAHYLISPLGLLSPKLMDLANFDLIGSNSSNRPMFFLRIFRFINTSPLQQKTFRKMILSEFTFLGLKNRTE